MKIVDYNTFINMPAGTVYAETEPSYVGGLKIKDDSIIFEDGGSDFFETSFDFVFDTAYEEMEKGNEIEAEFPMGRDGMFDYDRKFVVYSKEDVETIISEFTNALNKAYN